MKVHSLILAGALLAMSAATASAETLTPDVYLAQVRERSRELVTGPSAFANARLTRDEKLPTFPVFSYDRYDTRAYSAGVQGRTRFGLTAKLVHGLCRRVGSGLRRDSALVL